MISQKTILTVVTGEHAYEFHCDPQSPLGEVHDALARMKSHVVEQITKNQAAEEASKPQEGD